MKRPIHWVHLVQYAALRIVSALFLMFPIDVNLKTGRLIGWVWFNMPRWAPLLRSLSKHRGRAMDHIRLAYGDALDDAEVRRLALGSMQHFACLAIEVIQTPRIVTPWTWRRYVELDHLGEAARELLKRRGCIMLTAHYGSFEILGYALAMAGFPITALMRPFDNEYITDYLVEKRRRSGLELLFKKGATARAPDVLEDGGALCFIADQDAGRKGVFVDFFGQKASTYKSIGLLAIDQNVPIIVGCARRMGKRFRYRISVNRIIQPEEWRDRDDELTWITQEFSTAMERFIREAPEQYLWMHRRWKSQPRAQRKPAGVTPAG
jgi:KDO2-lipid IV(A) lauroyltransferase